MLNFRMSQTDLPLALLGSSDENKVIKASS